VMRCDVVIPLVKIKIAAYKASAEPNLFQQETRTSNQAVMSLTSYRAAPPRGKCPIFQASAEKGSAQATFFA
ncbi:MAG TPA: hypothetical protein VF760_11805, partial [Xanthobacteraceae bacterium]